MNRIKKMWNENRVMMVLGIIVLVCMIVILIVVANYFFGVSSSNYGSLLDDIQNVPFEETDKDKIVEEFQMEHLEKVTVDVRGKIIYIMALFSKEATLLDAQNKAVDVFNHVDEKYRKLYDFNITVYQESTDDFQGFHLMGAKNVSSSSFIWSNNTSLENGD